MNLSLVTGESSRNLVVTRKVVVSTQTSGHPVHIVQPADIGWPTGNGEKLSCSQAQLGQATCMAVV